MRNIIIFILIAFITSCDSDVKKPQAPLDEASIKEQMTTVNKYLSRSENDEIKAYIERRKWNTNSTASGIRYWVYEEGKGDSVKMKDRLKLKYVLSLINGAKCYDSSNDGMLNLEVGKYEVSGLNEALLLMKKGSKAKIVIPSHLGYGLLGDQNRVPSKATLIYDIEILNN